jgi:hypothetical protein
MTAATMLWHCRLTIAAAAQRVAVADRALSRGSAREPRHHRTCRASASASSRSPSGPTGCTVVLVDGDGAVGGVSQRGGAQPALARSDLLDPLNTVDRVKRRRAVRRQRATASTPAQGVVKYLEERPYRVERGSRGRGTLS